MSQAAALRTIKYCGGASGKEPPAKKKKKNPLTTQETRVREDPLEEGMSTHSSILAWRIPWTEEPGGFQSIGSQIWTQLK